jgi:hypothetical protein
MGLSIFPPVSSGGGASFGSYNFPANNTSYPISLTKGAYTLKNTTTSASVTYTFISSAGYIFTSTVANGFGFVVLPIDITSVKTDVSGITLEYYASTYSVLAAPTASWAWNGSSNGNQVGDITFSLAAGAIDFLVYWTDGTITDLTTSSPANGVTAYPTVQSSGVNRNMLVVGKDAAGQLGLGLVISTGATTQGFNYVGFTSSTSWTVPIGVTAVDVLVAGGGGGNASGYYFGPYSYGNGGQPGAGGYRFLTNQSVTPGASVAITVGAKGTDGVYNSSWESGRGGNSAFGSISATGGGGSRAQGGGGGESNQANGGSGGGPFSVNSSGFGGGTGNLGGYSPVEGYDGGNSVAASNGGGGGGAGGAGVGTANGPGVSNTISGTAVTYCQGGYGGTNTGSGAQNGVVRVRYFG